ncbi:MAG: type II toxin-antitoxin system Phd/YefM family antitoxin [Candidatus Hydrogenedentes bacterium]|nr:type II toxin-antitoxin system Phd/YefM family antitoxin [Candidatus Hydrogenedentota bacterium]
MTTFPTSRAGEILENLIAQVAESHEPVQIVGVSNTAVLISEEDWRSVQETLHLLSVPGMRESILEGIATPLDECSEEPGW